MNRNERTREDHPMHPAPRTTHRSMLRLGAASLACALGCAALPAAAATSVTLSLVPSATVAGAGEAIDVVVRLNASTPAGESPTAILGVQGVMRFDPSVFAPRIDPGQAGPILPIADGPFATLNAGASVDAASGAVTFFVLDGSFNGFTGASADVARLTLRVKDSVSGCGGSSLVHFATIGGNSTLVGQLPANSAQLSLVDLPAVSFDRAAPALVNLHGSISQPADADRSNGAVIPPPSPAVAAVDGCDPAPSVSLLVTFPDGATASAWPPVFPIGTTTLRWTARDASGNEASATRSVIVQNFQLLDAKIRFHGDFERDGPLFERSIRIRVGGLTYLRVLEFLPFDATATAFGIQIPVTTLPVCVEAKDQAHSLSDAVAATVVGTRYSANLLLLQGDSNDDDVVDIVDFSMFALAFGDYVDQDHPSNFNADGIVDNADFGPIAINYFKVGARCGALDGRTPRARVSVRELRRAGAGHLAEADLNRDGWIDQQDMQLFFGSAGHELRAED